MTEKVFNKAQYGKESPSAHGTEVDATKIWLGQVKVPEDRIPVFPPYNLAVRARSTEGRIYQKLVDGLTLEGPENGAYYQMLPAMFSIFFKGAITASEVTPAQSDYLWTFTPSLTASNALDSLTLEVGDDTQAFLIKYLAGKRLTMGAEMGQNQAVKCSLECFGDQLAKTTFTTALTKPSTEQMIANLTKLYVDTTWAGKGGTIRSAMLHAWEVEFLNGVVPKFHGNSLIYDSVGEGYIDCMLTLTVEAGAYAVTLFDAHQAQTPLAFEIQVPGSQIGTGSTYNVKFDIWGIPEQAIPLDSDVDGINMYKFVIHGVYGTVGTAMLAVTCTTNSNAV